MANRFRLCVGVAVIVALAAVVPGHAQQPNSGGPAQAPASTAGQPDQPPVFRAGINFVRVDVIVSDKNGNPVGDLKPEDFEVIEQGKPQAIETFKLVSLDGVPWTARISSCGRSSGGRRPSAARWLSLSSPRV